MKKESRELAEIREVLQECAKERIETLINIRKLEVELIGTSEGSLLPRMRDYLKDLQDTTNVYENMLSKHIETEWL